MVLDFDLRIFCQNLKATKPPYECPVKHCGKMYKSYCGIQFHLYNFDHNDPNACAVTPNRKPGNRRGSNSGRWHHRANRRSPTPPEFFREPDTMSYSESQRLVEIDVEGRLHRLNIYEQLEIISQDEIDNWSNTEKEEKPEKCPPKPSKDIQKPRKENATDATSQLPVATFNVLTDYVKPSEVPVRPSSYYRFIEKSFDEMDEEVEYDMDEEVGLCTIYFRFLVVNF